MTYISKYLTILKNKHKKEGNNEYFKNLITNSIIWSTFNEWI